MVRRNASFAVKTAQLKVCKEYLNTAQYCAGLSAILMSKDALYLHIECEYKAFGV